MIVYFSGGGRPWVPELCLEGSHIMLSYYTNYNRKSKKPDSRLRRVLKANKKKGGKK